MTLSRQHDYLTTFFAHFVVVFTLRNICNALKIYIKKNIVTAAREYTSNPPRSPACVSKFDSFKKGGIFDVGHQIWQLLLSLNSKLCMVVLVTVLTCHSLCVLEIYYFLFLCEHKTHYRAIPKFTLIFVILRRFSRFIFCYRLTKETSRKPKTL